MFRVWIGAAIDRARIFHGNRSVNESIWDFAGYRRAGDDRNAGDCVPGVPDDCGTWRGYLDAPAVGDCDLRSETVRGNMAWPDDIGEECVHGCSNGQESVAGAIQGSADWS